MDSLVWLVAGLLVALAGVVVRLVAAHVDPQRRIQRYRRQAIKCSCRLRLLAHRPIRADLGSDDLEELLHPGMMGRHKSVYTLVAGLPQPERRPVARRLQQMRRAEDRMHDRIQRLSELEPDRDYAEISNQIDEHGQRRFLEKIDPLTLEEKRRWRWRR